MADRFHKIMVQQAMQEIEEPVYCRFCGHNIKEPSYNSTKVSLENGSERWYSHWEIQNYAHEKCYQHYRFGGKQ